MINMILSIYGIIQILVMVYCLLEFTICYTT